jgi:quercetin dioxygenase-like cupin family protein
MKRAEHQPTSELTLFAGIYLKTYTVPDAQTLIPQHSHTHPHISLILSGAVRVWCDDRMLGQFIGPATIKIEAKRRHSFLTLTEGVVFACIHATDAVDDDALIHDLELEG